MTRLLLLCLSVTLVGACRKSEPPSNGSAPPAKEAAREEAKQAGAEPDAKQAGTADDGKVVLTPSLVRPFVAYRRDALAAVASASRAEREKATKKAGEGSDFDLDAAYAAALKRSGLTETQLSALDEIANELLSVPSGAEGAEAPAPAQLAPLARAKYGDGIVNAMLAQREELERLEEALELLAQANDDLAMEQEREEIMKAGEQEDLPEPAGTSSRCEIEGMVIDPDPAGLNVRADASARADIVGKIPRDEDGTIVELVDARDGWLRLRGFRPMNGDPVKADGWISGQMIATAVRCPDEAPGEACTAPLHKEPRTDATELRRLAVDSRLLIVGCRGTWVEGETTEANRGERARGWLAANGQCANPVTSCP